MCACAVAQGLSPLQWPGTLQTPTPATAVTAVADYFDAEWAFLNSPDVALARFPQVATSALAAALLSAAFSIDVPAAQKSAWAATAARLSARPLSNASAEALCRAADALLWANASGPVLAYVADTLALLGRLANHSAPQYSVADLGAGGAVPNDNALWGCTQALLPHMRRAVMAANEVVPGVTECRRGGGVEWCLDMLVPGEAAVQTMPGVSVALPAIWAGVWGLAGWRGRGGVRTQARDWPCCRLRAGALYARRVRYQVEGGDDGKALCLTVRIPGLGGCSSGAAAGHDPTPREGPPPPPLRTPNGCMGQASMDFMGAGDFVLGIQHVGVPPPPPRGPRRLTGRPIYVLGLGQ